MKRQQLSTVMLGIGIISGIIFSQFDALKNSVYAQGMPSGGCMGQWGNGNNRRGMMSSMRIHNEFDFLTKMIPHHQEAITTAKILLAGTQRPEMKKFAQDIIRVQSAEIEVMQAGLKEWYKGQSTQVEYVPMMRNLTQLKGSDLDRAFLQDMIMHHHGAIMMSQQLLNHGLAKHDSVKNLANQIRISQSQEIEQMQIWAKEWFGLTGMGCGRMMGP